VEAVQDLWHFILGRAALAVLVATAVLAWPVGRRVAERFGRSRAAAVLFVAAVGVVMALTLTPNYPVPGEPTAVSPHFLHHITDADMAWMALTSVPFDSEQIANIALYVPVGLFGRFVWGSTLRAAAFGMALTVFVETCQYGIVGRDGSITDIRNNAAGALLGALVAAAVAARVVPSTETSPANANATFPETDVPTPAVQPGTNPPPVGSEAVEVGEPEPTPPSTPDATASSEPAPPADGVTGTAAK
jgi:glycopeptide antibiotics resistance protein